MKPPMSLTIDAPAWSAASATGSLYVSTERTASVAPAIRRTASPTNAASSPASRTGTSARALSAPMSMMSAPVRRRGDRMAHGGIEIAAGAVARERVVGEVEDRHHVGSRAERQHMLAGVKRPARFQGQSQKSSVLRMTFSKSSSESCLWSGAIASASRPTG